MKTSKRLLSFFLAVVMAVSACSAGFSAFAAEPANEVFTYIDSEGKAVDITYDALEDLVNTYAPMLIQALGGTLEGIGVDVDAVCSAEKPIYELVAQLSPTLIGALGGSSSASSVLSNYTPIDELRYSYLNDEDAAMNFWSLYKFCDDNRTKGSAVTREYCNKVFPLLEELLNVYSEVNSEFTDKFNAAKAKIEEVLGNTVSTGHILYNAPSPEMEKAVEMLSESNLPNILYASLDNIGDVICKDGKALKDSFETGSDSEGNVVFSIDGVDVTPFVEYTKTYAKAAYVIGEDESFSLLDAIYYYYNTTLTDIALRVSLATSRGNSVTLTNGYGVSFDVAPNTYYADAIIEKGFTFDDFKNLMLSVYKLTVNEEDSFWYGAYLYFIYFGGAVDTTNVNQNREDTNKSSYYDSLCTVLVKAGIRESVEEIDKERDSCTFTDNEFVIIKERFLALARTHGGDSYTNSVTLEEFRKGAGTGSLEVGSLLSENLKDVYKYYFQNRFSDFLTLREELPNWNAGDPWTATMKKVAEAADASYAEYMCSCVLNNASIDANVKSYEINPVYTQLLIFNSCILPEVEKTGITYEWDDYKPENEVAIQIVNSLLNNLINTYLNPDDQIGKIVAGALDTLLESDIDLREILNDIYINLAEKPIETIMKLLPVLVILVDEIIFPILFNAPAYENTPADHYYNNTGGLLYNVLFNPNSFLKSDLLNYSQEAGSPIGVGQMRWDLNELLPAVLHWVLGDNDYTYTYYDVEEIFAEEPDENGEPVVESVVYGEKFTGTYGTKYDNDGNKTYLVPSFFNIYYLDSLIAGLSVKDLRDKTEDSSDPTSDGLGEVVTQLLTTLKEVVEEYVAEHKEDIKSYSSSNAPTAKGLNNILVALPSLIDGLGKKFNEKYGVDSDWSFGDISTTEDGCVYNVTLKKFKDLASNNASAEDCLGLVVDIFVNNWFNALTDFINDFISDTDNKLTSEIPIITALLNSLDGFGEQSIFTDILNGFFFMTRSHPDSFTFEERENGYVGLSTLSAYFLITNVQPIIDVIKSIVDANKSGSGNQETQPDEGDNQDTPPIESNDSSSGSSIDLDIEKLISDIDIQDEIYSQENIKAANELLDTIDAILSALLNNTFLNGYTINKTDGILSGVITFVLNHLDRKTIDDLGNLLLQYLDLINAESLNPNYKPQRNGNANGPVDAKKVYSKKNLSNLVTQTYVVIEEIIDSYLNINGDDNKCINSAIKGIISPSSVTVRSDVISDKILDYLSWSDINESKYKTDLGYNNLKAGDKETFYKDLFDSLGSITAIAGALLCTTGYYNNVFEPVIASVCDACGVSGYKKSLSATATGEDALMAIFESVSALLDKFLQAPATTLINLARGIVNILDDKVIGKVIKGAINPLIKEVNGLLNIVNYISPTFKDMLAGYVNPVINDINGYFSDEDIVVNLLNKLLGINLPPIDWASVKNITPGEIILFIYNVAAEAVLNDQILDLISNLINASVKDSKVDLNYIFGMLKKLDAVSVLNILKEVLSTIKNPTEFFWTFEKYLGQATNSFVYPSGITQSDADDAVDQLDELVANVFPLLQSFDVVDQSGLPELVNGLLFKNELLTKIAKAVYGGIENKAKGIFNFSPAQFAEYLTDSSYGTTFTSAANTLKKCSSWSQVQTINWGFKDGSAKAEQGFINGLAALCRPINDVLAVFLAEGEVDLFDLLSGVISDLRFGFNNNNDKDADIRYSITLENGVLNMYFLNAASADAQPNRIEIDVADWFNTINRASIAGSNGYENAIIPILEALTCNNVKTYSEYVKDYKKAKDNLILDILNPLFGFVDDVLEAPFDTISAALPNVAYFLDNNGLGKAINNLLAPITKDALSVLKENGIDVDAIITKLIGKDLGSLVMDKLGVKGNLSLKIGDLDSCNIQDFLIPILNELLLKKYNIVLPDFDWATIASHGTKRTVSSAARNSDGDFTAIKIVANQGETLVAVLRYIADALISNSASIKNLICSIEKVSKNKTIVNIITSIFNQLSAAHKDQIVQAVFYLLTQDPQNAFFDYRGFKYKDYDFSYPSTVDVDFLTVIGPMLDGLIGGLVDGGLNKLIGNLIYKDDIISSIAVGLYGAVEGVKINSSMNLTQLLAKTDIDFSTGNVANLLTDKDYGTSYSNAAKVIKNAGSWSKVDKAKLSWGVTDRDSFIHALCAVLRPIYGVLDVLLNDGSLGLFKLIYLPGSDGYTSAIIPLMEAFGLYNIKTQYQYRQDINKEYDAILLDILNPLMDKVEDILNAPIEMIADMLPNLSLFFANDGLLQLIENLLTPINALLDSIKPIVDVNDLLKTLGLDIDKEIGKLGLGVKNFHFDIYDLAGTLKPLIGSDNIVNLLNSVLGLIKIKGQPLNLELMQIDWYQLASHGTVITDEASQAATFGSRVYVKADPSEVLIAVLRYLVNTINYKDNFNIINNLIGGLLGNVSDSVSNIISSVLNVLTGETDDVISALCDLLKTFA